MKLLRVGDKEKEIPAILDKQNKIRNLSNYIEDFNPKNLNFDTMNKIKDLDFKTLPEIDSKTRIGACVSNPGNFFAIGLNYKAHAEETGAKPPEFPVVLRPDTILVIATLDPTDNS